MAAQGLQLPISLQIQNLQDVAAQLKKFANSNVLGDSLGGKKIDAELTKVLHTLSQIELKSKNAFKTDADFSTLEREINKVELSIDRIQSSFKGLKFDEIKIPSDAKDQLDALNAQIQALRNNFGAFKAAQKDKLLQNVDFTGNLSKAFGKDAASMMTKNYDEMYQAIERGMARINAKLLAAKAEFQMNSQLVTQNPEGKAKFSAFGALDFLEQAFKSLPADRSKYTKQQEMLAKYMQIDTINKETGEQGFTKFKSGGAATQFFHQLASMYEITPDQMEQIRKRITETARALQVSAGEALRQAATDRGTGASVFGGKGVSYDQLLAGKEQYEASMKTASDSGIRVDQIQAQVDAASEAWRSLQTVQQEVAASQKVLDDALRAPTASLTELQNAVLQSVTNMPQLSAAFGQAATEIYNLRQAADVGRQQLAQLDQTLGKLSGVSNFINRYVGIYAIVRKVTTAIRNAFANIKELDKNITNIAVVTNMSQSELWGKIGEYTAMAQQYGVATKDVYTVSQLFYQQGLQTNQVMSLTTETLKMAKISGMEYSDAANAMTVAIRAFKIEMTDAQQVTDVYSALAAKFAVSSSEIANAMEKTASSAANVGMSLESTSAFISVMTQTTRESAQNIGSALKSIISRYGEMKASPSKLLNVDGEDVAFNKVDTALKSIGISIKDASGQFRDFDDVILELASKWDTLDNNTQRYIATVMAGNRQQSRFIALVSNYDELNRAIQTANNSENASVVQVAKTMDSLESKAQQLKNAFSQVYLDLHIEDGLKDAYDWLTRIMKTIGKLGILNGALPTLANIIGLGTGTKSLVNYAKEGVLEHRRNIEKKIELNDADARKKAEELNTLLEKTITKQVNINVMDQNPTNVASTTAALMNDPSVNAAMTPALIGAIQRSNPNMSEDQIRNNLYGALASGQLASPADQKAYLDKMHVPEGVQEGEGGALSELEGLATAAQNATNSLETVGTSGTNASTGLENAGRSGDEASTGLQNAAQGAEQAGTAEQTKASSAVEAAQADLNKAVEAREAARADLQKAQEAAQAATADNEQAQSSSLLSASEKELMADKAASKQAELESARAAFEKARADAAAARSALSKAQADEEGAQSDRDEAEASHEAAEADREEASGNGKGGISRGTLMKGIGVASGVARLAGTAITAAGAAHKDKSTDNVETSKILTGVGNGLSMAGTGASMGMAFGPWGALVGAIGGFLIGGLGAILDGLEVTLDERVQMLQEEAEEANEESLKKQAEVTDLSSSLENLKNLKAAMYNSTEDMAAYQDAVNQMAEAYPSLISAYDSAGNAVIDLQAAEELLIQTRAEAAAEARKAAIANAKVKQEQTKGTKELVPKIQGMMNKYGGSTALVEMNGQMVETRVANRIGNAGTANGGDVQKYLREVLQFVYNEDKGAGMQEWSRYEKYLDPDVQFELQDLKDLTAWVRSKTWGAVPGANGGYGRFQYNGKDTNVDYITSDSDVNEYWQSIRYNNEQLKRFEDSLDNGEVVSDDSVISALNSWIEKNQHVLNTDAKTAKEYFKWQGDSPTYAELENALKTVNARINQLEASEKAYIKQGGIAYSQEFLYNNALTSGLSTEQQSNITSKSVYSNLIYQRMKALASTPEHNYEGNLLAWQDADNGEFERWGNGVAEEILAWYKKQSTVFIENFEAAVSDTTIYRSTDDMLKAAGVSKDDPVAEGLIQQFMDDNEENRKRILSAIYTSNTDFEGNQFYVRSINEDMKGLAKLTKKTGRNEAVHIASLFEGDENGASQIISKYADFFTNQLVAINKLAEQGYTEIASKRLDALSKISDALAGIKDSKVQNDLYSTISKVDLNSYDSIVSTYKAIRDYGIKNNKMDEVAPLLAELEAAQATLVYNVTTLASELTTKITSAAKDIDSILTTNKSGLTLDKAIEAFDKLQSSFSELTSFDQVFTYDAALGKYVYTTEGLEKAIAAKEQELADHAEQLSDTAAIYTGRITHTIAGKNGNSWKSASLRAFSPNTNYKTANGKVDTSTINGIAYQLEYGHESGDDYMTHEYSYRADIEEALQKHWGIDPNDAGIKAILDEQEKNGKFTLQGVRDTYLSSHKNGAYGYAEEIMQDVGKFLGEEDQDLLPYYQEMATDFMNIAADDEKYGEKTWENYLAYIEEVANSNQENAEAAQKLLAEYRANKKNQLYGAIDWSKLSLGTDYTGTNKQMMESLAKELGILVEELDEEGNVIGQHWLEGYKGTWDEVMDKYFDELYGDDEEAKAAAKAAVKGQIKKSESDQVANAITEVLNGEGAVLSEATMALVQNRSDLTINDGVITAGDNFVATAKALYQDHAANLLSLADKNSTYSAILNKQFEQPNQAITALSSAASMDLSTLTDTFTKFGAELAQWYNGESWQGGLEFAMKTDAFGKTQITDWDLFLEKLNVNLSDEVLGSFEYQNAYSTYVDGMITLNTQMIDLIKKNYDNAFSTITEWKPVNVSKLAENEDLVKKLTKNNAAIIDGGQLIVKDAVEYAKNTSELFVALSSADVGWLYDKTGWTKADIAKNWKNAQTVITAVQDTWTGLAENISSLSTDNISTLVEKGNFSLSDLTSGVFTKIGDTYALKLEEYKKYLVEAVGGEGADYTELSPNLQKKVDEAYNKAEQAIVNKINGLEWSKILDGTATAADQDTFTKGLQESLASLGIALSSYYNTDGTLNLSALVGTLQNLNTEASKAIVKNITENIAETRDGILSEIDTAMSHAMSGTKNIADIQKFIESYNKLNPENTIDMSAFSYDTNLGQFTLSGTVLKQYISSQKKALEQLGLSSEVINAYIKDQTTKLLQQEMDISSILDDTDANAQKTAMNNLATTVQNYLDLGNKVYRAATEEEIAKYEELVAFEEASTTMEEASERSQALEAYERELKEARALSTEQIIDTLYRGGAEAVKILKQLKGDEVTADEVSAVYNAGMNRIKAAEEALSSGAGTILTGLAASIATTSTGIETQTLPDGSVVITAVTDMTQAYVSLYQQMAATAEATTADLNSMFAKVLTAKDQGNIDAISTLGDAMGMSYDSLGQLLATYGKDEWSSLEYMMLHQYTAGIEALGNGQIRIVDWEKFSSQMNWEVSGEAYMEAYNAYNDSLIELDRKAGKKIVEQIKNVSEAKTGDKINITYLTEAVEGGSEAVNAALFGMGAEVKNGILTIKDGARVGDIVATLANMAKDSGQAITSELAELADAVEEFIDNIVSLIKNGIGGSLKNSEANTLKEWAKTYAGIEDLDFTRTAEGLQLSEQSAIALYAALKKVDSVKASLVFDELSDSLAKNNDNFKSTSALMGHIKKISEGIYASDGKTSKARLQQYEAELSVAKEILAVRSTQEDDSFNFMSNKIPAAQNNPLNYAKNWTQALQSIRDAFKVKKGGKTGFIDYEDWYNIATEINNMAAVTGKEIKLGSLTFKGDLESASKAIQAGAESLTTVDTGDLKVNLASVGIGIKSGADALSSGVTEGIQGVAKAQVKALDGIIAMLELIVAMEQLGDIDTDGNGIDLSDLFEVTYDENGNKQVNYEKFSADYQKWVNDIKDKINKDSANYNKDLANAVNGIKIDGHALVDMLDWTPGQFTDPANANVAKAYAAMLDAFNKAALSGNYDLDNIQQSVLQVLAESGFDDTVTLDIGDMTYVISAGTMTTIDWTDTDTDAILTELAKKYNNDKTKARAELTTWIQQYGSGEPLGTEELHYVLQVKKKITMEDGKVTSVTVGGKTYNTTNSSQSEMDAAVNAAVLEDFGYDVTNWKIKDPKTGAVEVETKIGNKTIKVESEKGQVRLVSQDGKRKYKNQAEFLKGEWEQWQKDVKGTQGEKAYKSQEEWQWGEYKVATKVDPKFIVTKTGETVTPDSDPNLRSQLTDILNGGHDAVAKYFNEHATDNKNGTYTVDIGGYQFTFTGGENAITNFENEIGSALGIDIGLSNTISTAIANAFANQDVKDSVSEAIKTGMQNAFGGIEGETTEIPIPSITLKPTEINIDTSGVKTEGGASTDSLGINLDALTAVVATFTTTGDPNELVNALAGVIASYTGTGDPNVLVNSLAAVITSFGKTADPNDMVNALAAIITSYSNGGDPNSVTSALSALVTVYTNGGDPNGLVNALAALVTTYENEGTPDSLVSALSAIVTAFDKTADPNTLVNALAAIISTYTNGGDPNSLVNGLVAYIKQYQNGEGVTPPGLDDLTQTVSDIETKEADTKLETWRSAQEQKKITIQAEVSTEPTEDNAGVTRLRSGIYGQAHHMNYSDRQPMVTNYRLYNEDIPDLTNYLNQLESTVNAGERLSAVDFTNIEALSNEGSFSVAGAFADQIERIYNAAKTNEADFQGDLAAMASFFSGDLDSASIESVAAAMERLANAVSVLTGADWGGIADGINSLNGETPKQQNTPTTAGAEQQADTNLAQLGTTAADTATDTNKLGTEAYTASQHVSKMGELAGGAEHEIEQLGEVAGQVAALLKPSEGGSEGEGEGTNTGDVAGQVDAAADAFNNAAAAASEAGSAADGAAGQQETLGSSIATAGENAGTAAPQIQTMGANSTTTGGNAQSAAASIQALANAISSIPGYTSHEVKLSISAKVTSSEGKGTVSLSSISPTQLTAASFAKGRAKAGGTLMGELGPELVVSNGRYFVVGQGGAEFVDLAPDAIVFNHKQTASLLSNGKAGRGKPITNEDKAISWAKGNIGGGPAKASASAALAALKQLRAQWDALANLSAKDLLGGGGGGGGGGNKAYIKELEKWFNWLQKIAALEKDINYYEAQRNRINSEWNASGHEYFNSQMNSLNALQQQARIQNDLLKSQKEYFEKRRKEMNDNSNPFTALYTFDEHGQIQYKPGMMEKLNSILAADDTGKPNMTPEEQYKAIIAMNPEYAKYMKYDSSGNKIKDDDYAAMVQAFVDKMDKDKSEMQSEYDSYEQLYSTLQQSLQSQNEILRSMRDNQKELEQKIYDTIVDMRQRAIDDAQDTRDALAESYDKLMTGLNNALQKEQAQYQRDENDKDLREKRNQLNILRRTGGSGTEISNLEKEIADLEKTTYFDEQQKYLDELQEAQDKQLEKMDQEISIMTEELEFEKKYGLLWDEVTLMMQNSPEEIANFIATNNSEYWDKSPITREEDMQKLLFMSEQWVDFRDVGMAQLQTSIDEIKAALAEREGNNSDLGSDQGEDSGSGSDGDSGDQGGGGGDNPSGTPTTNHGYKFTYNGVDSSNSGYASKADAEKAANTAISNKAKAERDQAGKDFPNGGTQYEYAYQQANKHETDAKTTIKAYKTGGMNDYTGLAVMHGTKKKPEAVFNAEQTQILRTKILGGGKKSLLNLLGTLQDALANTANQSTYNTINTGGGVTFDGTSVNMNFNEVSDDYDARKAGEEAMKEMLRVARKTAVNSLSRG